MLDFSVIIPTFQRPSALAAAVEQWLQVDFPPGAFELIVVDDEGQGTVRRTLGQLSHGRLPAVRVIEGGTRSAFAARNLGAAGASGRIVIFSDDDVRVRPDHLHQQVRTRELCGDDCLVTAMWDYAPEVKRELAQSSFGRFLLSGVMVDQACVTHLVTSCWETNAADSVNLSLPRELFERLGRFGPNLRGAGYWEDCLLGWRAQRRGAALIRNRELVVDSYDPRRSLRQICAREEQVAADYAGLSAAAPDEFHEVDYFVSNGLVRRTDSLRVRLKKALKTIASRPIPLEPMMLAAELGERLRVPDRALHPYFAQLISLHTLRGLQRTTAAA